MDQPNEVERMELAAVGSMGADVGPREVVALEQQRLAGRLGQRKRSSRQN
jgi:hypothetical protein